MRRLLAACVLGAVALAVTMNAFGGSPAKDPLYEAATEDGARVLSVKVKTPAGATVRVRKSVPEFSDGVLHALAPSSTPQQHSVLNASASSVNLGQSLGSVGCSQRNPGGDVRVNQDCGFQPQAEESIAFNPVDQSNLIAGHNDAGQGAPFCGADWSNDTGRHWGTLPAPEHYKLNNPPEQLPTTGDPNRNTLYGDPGTHHPYYLSSDPGVAFDSRGRAFLSCVNADVFHVTGDFASGLWVMASPPGAKGSFYVPIGESPNVVQFAVGEQRAYTVVEDNTVRVFHDKPFVTADANPGSPNRDNVYVTWTAILFDAEGNFREEPIYGSMSTDHGVTWSTPEEISGSSEALCVGGNSFDPTLSPTACNISQGSDPKVLANGDLAVAFWNFNTPTVNNQELAVHCHPSGSSPAGTAHLSCDTPAKIGDDIQASEPFCKHLGECAPGPLIRVKDPPRLAVNPANGHLYAVWNDYRNGEFDIQMASSTDGGMTWSSTSTVNPDRGLDHFEAAIDVAKGRDHQEQGLFSSAATVDHVGVSYQRSARVPNENATPPGGFKSGDPGVQTEPSDTVLAGGTGTTTPFPFKLIGPAFPPPDGNQTGFLGDYTGITIPSGTEAHPIWADTRNVDPFAEVNGSTHDADIFTAVQQLPNGVAHIEPGTIGQPSNGGESGASGSP
jgi:hypothetical protein